MMRRKRVDERVDAAVHHAIELVQRESDAVIGDAVLGEVVGSDLVRAVARFHHTASFVANGGILLLALDLEQPAAKDLERLRAILELTALVLTFDDHAGRKVRDLDGAVRRVHALTAGTPRSGD